MGTNKNVDLHIRNYIMFLSQAGKSSIWTNEIEDQSEGRIVDKMHGPNKVSKSL